MSIFYPISSARGDYYLQTSGERPFSRGPDGLRYEKMKYDPQRLFIGQKTVRRKRSDRLVAPV